MRDGTYVVAALFGEHSLAQVVFIKSGTECPGLKGPPETMLGFLPRGDFLRTCWYQEVLQLVEASTLQPISARVSLVCNPPFDMPRSEEGLRPVIRDSISPEPFIPLQNSPHANSVAFHAGVCSSQRSGFKRPPGLCWGWEGGSTALPSCLPPPCPLSPSLPSDRYYNLCGVSPEGPGSFPLSFSQPRYS